MPSPPCARPLNWLPASVARTLQPGAHARPGRPSKGVGIPEYRKALKIDPADVDSLINLAVDLGEEDAPEAKDLLARALKADPKNAKAHLNLGLLLKKIRTRCRRCGTARSGPSESKTPGSSPAAHSDARLQVASGRKSWTQCRKMLE